MENLQNKVSLLLSLVYSCTRFIHCILECVCHVKFLIFKTCINIKGMGLGLAICRPFYSMRLV
jgi:hypothetical protein